MKLTFFLILLALAFGQVVKHADSSRKPSLIAVGLLCGAVSSFATLLQVYA